MEHKQELGHKEPRLDALDETTIDGSSTTTEEGVSFFHDFVAGGVAGSASVVVGHPFDTLKVNISPQDSQIRLSNPPHLHSKTW